MLAVRESRKQKKTDDYAKRLCFCFFKSPHAIVFFRSLINESARTHPGCLSLRYVPRQTRKRTSDGRRRQTGPRGATVMKSVWVVFFIYLFYIRPTP